MEHAGWYRKCLIGADLDQNKKAQFAHSID